ncbi:SEL1-like repeat protein, partial [Venenivibrio stagnispumantis]|nr:SEL1-like repeat protein [Venenivibrio stagnispumantis]
MKKIHILSLSLIALIFIFAFIYNLEKEKTLTEKCMKNNDVKTCEILCKEKNKSESCNNLGEMYYYGEGVEQDYVKAAG